MGRKLNTLCKAAMIFIAALVLVLSLLEPVLDRIVVPELARKYAREYLDADFFSSRIRIRVFRHFPMLGVELDSVSLATPGDTLVVSSDRIRASVHALRAINKDIYVPSLTLEGLSVTHDALTLSGQAYAAELDVKIGEESIDIDFGSLDVDVAHLPLHASGSVSLVGDSYPMDVTASVKDVDVAAFVKDVAIAFLPELASLETDARLSMDLRAKGVYSDSTLPEAFLHVELPRSRIAMKPLALDLRAQLDADAALDSLRKVSVDLRRLFVAMSGCSLNANGRLMDITGSDPRFKLSALADAELGTILAGLHLDTVYTASGRVNLSARADVSKSQLETYNFEKSSFSADLHTSGLALAVPADSMSAELFKTNVSVSAGKHGLMADIAADSLVFSKGDSLRARVRRMTDRARLFKVEHRGQLTPRMEFAMEGRSIFLRYGSSRAGLQRFNLGLQAQKRIHRQDTSRRRRWDSLRVAMGQHPEQDARLVASDIQVKMDSAVTNFIKEWNPSGNISVDRGFVATPMMPLRTRLAGLKGDFDGDQLKIDTMSLVCGTSDVALSGYLRGIRRTLLRKGFIRSDLAIRSGRLNVNELVAAARQGKLLSVNEADGAVAENDESFVVDSLSDAQIDRSSLKAFLLPGNINAKLALQVDRLDIFDVAVEPLTASLQLKDRILQLCDGKMETMMGGIGLDAYYSTKSLDDISLGFGMDLHRMQAHDIISILPDVDSFMPALKSFDGLLDCHVSATTQLDTNMSAIIPTLNGVIRMSGNNLLISDVGDLRKITRMLMFKNKESIAVAEMGVNAVVHNSRLEVFPFELLVDRYKLALQGMQNFDGTMYYHMSILKSPLPFRFGIDVYGSFDDWHFSLARARYSEGKVPAFSQELDKMQLNFAGSIRDVYQRGVRKVMEFNELNYEKESKPLDQKEYSQADALLFSSEQTEEEQIQQEIDAILEESFSDIEKMIEDYHASVYGNKVQKKLDLFKKKKK